MQDFKRDVKLYVDLKQEIGADNKKLREKRKRATAMEKDLLKTMQEEHIKKVDVKKGFVLKLQEKETVPALKPEFIIQQLKEQHQMEEDRATELVNAILDSRPKTKKAKLSLCEAKKSAQ
jgi:hypothetical protein